MIAVDSLPALNACLNAASAVLLLAGYLCIRQGRVAWHRLCMVSAFIVSAVFLASYLTYHYHAGHVPFLGQGWIRPVYFTILITHTSLAVVNVPLILRTLYLAFHNRIEEHRRAARWTWPSWMYVSVTGVVVYWMVFRMYGPR